MTSGAHARLGPSSDAAVGADPGNPSPVDVLDWDAGSPGAVGPGAGRALRAASRRLPPTLARGRFSLTSPAAVGLCLVAVLALVGGTLLLVHGRSHAATLREVSSDTDDHLAAGSGGREVSTGAAAGAVDAAAGSRMAAAAPTQPPVVVDVVGEVTHAGVYQVPAGSRLSDALRAAGGALPGVDLTSLDLASKVQDGEQVRVGIGPVTDGAKDSSVTNGPDSADADPSAAAAGASGSAVSAQDPVDINAADATQLDALPGIGPALAGRIVAWRQAHGSFPNVAALGEVPGLGPSKMAELTPLVRA